MEVRLARDRDEVDQALALREHVFCVEQGVPLAADRDGLDELAVHIVAVESGRVIGTCRVLLGAEAFHSWGWRLPFLASFVLLGVSLYIRLKMQESPLFARLKSEGQVSRNPLAESFANFGLRER